MRRVLLAVLIVLAVLLAVNTIASDRETEAAKAGAGRIVDLPGGDLQVREDGPSDAQALVLLHGFASSIHWWDRMTPALAHDHRVIRFDLLGHGGSEKPQEGYGMESQARLVAGALDRLGVRRAAIVGHSMGGSVATALAEERPTLVESVVILDSPSSSGDAQLPLTARLGFVPVLGQAIKRIVPDGMIRNGLESAFADGFEVPDRFVEDFREMTYTSYDDSHRGSDDYSKESGLAERLADDSVPLLVIFGSDDELVDPESAQGYRRVPGARIVVLDGVGHSPHVERPAATARLIENFLAQDPDS
ncbi:MAG: alpha/beta fold hydrolase [Solirubrobacterales bacterium]